MHRASAFKLKFYRLWCTKYNLLSSRGPLSRTRFIPMDKHYRVKVHMYVWTIPEYPKRHSSYLSDSGIPSYYFLYFCHLSKKNAAQFDFQLDSKATWSELAIYYLNDNSYLMNMYISNTSFNNKVLTCISKGHNNGRDIIKSVIHILTFVSENQRWGAKLARLSYKY